MLVNMTPKKGCSKSRVEMFTGRKPSARYLRRFGCLAYVKLQKQGKFDPVSVAGMFIGYAPGRKAYRVAVGGKVILVSPSVVFDESRNGIDVLRNRDAIPAGLSLQPLVGLQALPGSEEIVNLAEGEEFGVQWPEPEGQKVLESPVGTGVYVDIERRGPGNLKSHPLPVSGEVESHPLQEVEEEEVDAWNFHLERLMHNHVALNLLDLDFGEGGEAPQETDSSGPGGVSNTPTNHEDGHEQKSSGPSLDQDTPQAPLEDGPPQKSSGLSSAEEATQRGVKRGRQAKRTCRQGREPGPDRAAQNMEKMADYIRQLARIGGEANALAGRGVGQTPLEREPEHPAEALSLIHI